MKIISPLQCRGARAILNMTRGDLAELSGIAAGTIGSFETETAETRVQAISTLRLTLEGAGAEFIDTDGVRLRRDYIRTYEGKAVHRQLLDEIYADLKDKGGEILIRGLTERKWDGGDDGAFLRNHLDRLMRSNITERILLSETDDVLVAPKHWYRKVPHKYFSSQTHWIFGDKVAMCTWGDIEKVTIIESRALAEAESGTFNCIWDNVAQVFD